MTYQLGANEAAVHLTSETRALITLMGPKPPVLFRDDVIEHNGWKFRVVARLPSKRDRGRFRPRSVVEIISRPEAPAPQGA